MVTQNCETETILTQNADESTISKTSSEGNCLSRLRRWFIVEPILILYVFGVFPVQTIAQKYILHRITNESLHILTSQNISDHPTNTTFDPCHSNTSDPIYQFQEYVQSKSSQFVLYESIINGVPAIFVTIILGASSDIFGRRFAILPPLVGALLGSSIYTYVICTEASIHWLFVGDAVIGCCGSFYAVLMGCLAYVADRTPPEKLMIRITVIELTMFIPGVISPIVCGKVTTAFGYLIPLLFIIAASAVNLVYALIFLPNETKGSKELHVSTAESLPECPSSTERSSCFSVLSLLWIRICSMVTLFTDKSASTDAGVRCGRMRLNLLIASFFVTKIPVALYDVSKKTLFMMNSPLCWDLDMIGLFSGVTFAVSGVGAIIVTPLFKCCGIMEYVIAILAGLVCTATNVYTVFVKTTVMMFLTLSLSMVGILLDPSLRSMMSNQVNDHQQGVIFGAIACVEVTCDLIGTVVFNSVYSSTLFISTGFVFLVMAAFYAAGTVIVCAYAVLIKLEGRIEPDNLSVPINEPLLDDAAPDPLDDRIS